MIYIYFKWCRNVFICFLFPILSIAAQVTATSGSVYLKADEDSYVGGGLGDNHEVSWTHGVEGTFTISTNFNEGATVSFNDGNFWSFNFAAPKFNAQTNENSGNRLEVKFYDKATRHPFNSPTVPGLDFSGNGRGNNKSSGWFDVLEVEYNDDEEILRLAVDFRQFDGSEDMSGPSTFGSLRINSSIAVNKAGVVQNPVNAIETNNYPEFFFTNKEGLTKHTQHYTFKI